MTGPLYDLECAAEHADAAATPPPGTYAPGGRWERVLRALDTRGPLKASQVFAATRGADHTGKAERAKVWRALVGLQHLGFVEFYGGGGFGARFALTPRGRSVLQDGEAV